MPADVVVTAEELTYRTILRKDLKEDRAAFLDTKIPGSEAKINYPLIGPGVSENADQVIPVTEPHGFNLGGAVMPAGVINNLHLHFTAEVFMCFAGEWHFRWGVDGADGEADRRRRGRHLDPDLDLPWLHEQDRRCLALYRAGPRR